MTHAELIHHTLEDHADLARRTLADCSPAIEAAAAAMIACLESGGTVFACGNGGSAADAQHFAGELVGRFLIKDRRALPAVALTVDSSIMTAVANDFGYEHVFARQIEGLARAGDVVLGITTSGRSPNILAAFDAAYKLGAVCVALVGRDTSAVAPYASRAVAIPHPSTPRIQEMHLTVIHLWCDMIDRHFGRKK